MEQKNTTINDTDYTLQRVYPIEWVKIRDRSKNKFGVPSEEKMFKEVLAHIVVEPKRKLEDFKVWSELEELVKEAIRFQQGGDEE